MKARRAVRAVFLAGLLFASTASALGVKISSAAAHAGGIEQLFPSEVKATPDAHGWEIRVTLVDADSSKPARGFGVTARGVSASSSTSFGPVTLVDPDNTGDYVGHVSILGGGWTVTIEAKSVPGGPAGIPFAKAYDVTFSSSSWTSGSASRVASHSSRAPWLALITVLGLIIAALSVQRHRTKRLPPEEAFTGASRGTTDGPGSLEVGPSR